MKDHAVVVGVDVMAMYVLVGRTEMKIDVACQPDAVLGGDYGIAEVRHRARASPVGIDHPEPSTVLCGQALGKRVGPFPETSYGPLRWSFAWLTPSDFCD